MKKLFTFDMSFLEFMGIYQKEAKEVLSLEC